MEDPKTEIRRRAEIRKPPSEVAGRLHGPRKSEGRTLVAGSRRRRRAREKPSCKRVGSGPHRSCARCFRLSDFGSRISFGFRISFGCSVCCGLLSRFVQGLVRPPKELKKVITSRRRRAKMECVLDNEASTAWNRTRAVRSPTAPARRDRSAVKGSWRRDRRSRVGLSRAGWWLAASRSEGWLRPQ